MAKINEITVWKDRKIQIQQYEPYSFAYGVKAEVEKGDDIQAVKDELEAWVDKWLNWEVKKFKDPKGAVKDISNGDVPFN